MSKKEKVLLLSASDINLLFLSHGRFLYNISGESLSTTDNLQCRMNKPFKYIHVSGQQICHMWGDSCLTGNTYSTPFAIDDVGWIQGGVRHIKLAIKTVTGKKDFDLFFYYQNKSKYCIKLNCALGTY